MIFYPFIFYLKRKKEIRLLSNTHIQKRGKVVLIQRYRIFIDGIVVSLKKSFNTNSENKFVLKVKIYVCFWT